MPIILITGATAGFGEATARRFAREGWRLILLARRHDKLEKLAAELKVPTHLITADVRDRAAMEQAIATLPGAFRDVDVLVNNAGLALGLEPAHKCDLDQWETMVSTNINGLLYGTRLVLPGMVERGRGHVVNVGSVAGNYCYPGGNVYGATKAFVNHFSMNLRADLLGTPVRVTSIEPGMAETEFSLVRFGGDGKRAAKVYEGVQPLGADDVAEAIWWAVNQPAHVNINRIELMPVCQAPGAMAVARDK